MGDDRFSPPGGSGFAFVVSGGDLYIGGALALVDGNPNSKNIGKWNGRSWTALSNGVDNTVRTIALDGTNLYAGGDFTNASGVAASRVAKWNGASWEALGSGVSGGIVTSVRAIAVSGNTVYVGGSFTTAGGVATTGLAKWDGATWSTVGASGLSAFASVYAIAVGVDGLYVGGSFRTAGGINATNIARWDGTNWLSLGFGLGTSPGTLVNAITVIGTDVYVGGSFTNSGGIGVSRIARWNGSGWSALGGGLSATVNGLAAGSDMVFVAGGFTLAGSRPSASFAVWQADTSFPFNLTFLALPGSRVISWPSIPGKSYEMFSTTNLGESFSPLGGNIDSGGSSTSYTNIPAGESIRFFRVRQKP